MSELVNREEISRRYKGSGGKIRKNIRKYDRLVERIESKVKEICDDFFKTN